MTAEMYLTIFIMSVIFIAVGSILFLKSIHRTKQIKVLIANCDSLESISARKDKLIEEYSDRLKEEQRQTADLNLKLLKIEEEKNIDKQDVQEQKDLSEVNEIPFSIYEVINGESDTSRKVVKVIDQIQETVLMYLLAKGQLQVKVSVIKGENALLNTTFLFKFAPEGTYEPKFVDLATLTAYRRFLIDGLKQVYQEADILEFGG